MGSRTKYAGIIGNVVDETAHTIVVRTPCRDKRVPKRGCVFRVSGRPVSFEDIDGRPEERLKK
jgi:RNase P/RNase MRP subunit p29